LRHQTQILSSRHDSMVLDEIKAGLEKIAKAVKDAKIRMKSRVDMRKKYQETKSTVRAHPQLLVHLSLSLGSER